MSKYHEEKHVGSDFEDFLAAEERLEESTAIAMKCVISWQIQKALLETHEHEHPGAAGR